MKWVCTKINELSHRTGIGNIKLFITVSMVVCGLAGCAAALLLHMIPMLPIFLTNFPNSAKNIPLVLIILAAASSPA